MDRQTGCVGGKEGVKVDGSVGRREGKKKGGWRGWMNEWTNGYGFCGELVGIPGPSTIAFSQDQNYSKNHQGMGCGFRNKDKLLTS